MKKLILLTSFAATMLAASGAVPTRTVNIQGTDYNVQTLVQRPIGPGMTYYRLRVPSFPLNVNMVTVDTRNPHIKIETSLPKDRSAGTELLTEAAKRYDAPDHHAVVAQNGNFWIVTNQQYYEVYGPSTHNINMRNGMLAIDSKTYPAWWWWNSEHAGIVGATDANELFIDVCKTEMYAQCDKFGRFDIASCNKGIRPGEMGMYTSWLDPDRSFMPLTDNNLNFTYLEYNAACTELLCAIADGEQWSGGKDMQFIVKEVRTGNGHGKIGNHDLALVARTADVPGIENVVPGDRITLNYSWVFNRDGQDVRPQITQAIGGNMMVMKDGQITEQNGWDGYNTMIYSRSAYGTSADNKTLYMVVIDKSSDLKYGASNGCTTADMCDLMRAFGCQNLINVDAGGSAELMVDKRIINTTTEGNPRAVGNGWMVFNTAPDNDTEVAALAFYDIDLSTPVLSTYTPRMIALNKYGTVINDDFKDFEITSPSSDMGYGAGSSFIAADKTGQASITATAPGGITVSTTLDIVDATPAFKLDRVVIDSKHPYTVEIQSEYRGQQYPVEPWRAQLSVDNEEIAAVNEHGVLYAVKNGQATLTGNVGSMTQSIPVSVENVEQPTISLCPSFDGWTLKSGTGVKLGTPAENGTIPFNYGSPRGSAKITLTRDADKVELYGLPRAVVVEFQSSIPVKTLDMTLRKNGEKRGSMTKAPADGTEYPAGTPVTVRFETAELGDPDYVGTYPLSLSEIEFAYNVKSAYKGDQTLLISSIHAEYNDDSAVDDITAPDAPLTITPSGVNPGMPVAVSGSDIVEVRIFDMAGNTVAEKKQQPATMTVNAPMTKGIYIVRARTADGKSAAAKLHVF